MHTHCSEVYDASVALLYSASFHLQHWKQKLTDAGEVGCYDGERGSCKQFSSISALAERFAERFKLVDDGLTPAQCPTPLRCWGTPPSSCLGSGVTWPSPAAAPPVRVSSSWLLQRAAAVIYERPALRRWTGCRPICTFHPVQSRSPFDAQMPTTNRHYFLCSVVTVTLQEKESQALEFGNSLSSSTRASASLILGIVSKAMRSAAAKHSICGRCQALSSLEEKRNKVKTAWFYSNGALSKRTDMHPSCSIFFLHYTYFDT